MTDPAEKTAQPPIRGHPVFAPPKGGKERTVPLPDVVSVALAEQLRR